jgi:hypothetical protein
MYLGIQQNHLVNITNEHINPLRIIHELRYIADLYSCETKKTGPFFDPVFHIKYKVY